ncbi:alanine racemase [Treponema phagedenis]|uniref:alanine racemase n=1 Tax=Treponema phagedenis TaxID=162 RepID=UPI0001F63B78|nr:alanine racemase [Treponema phagedenis]EFW38563.1 alanine racemase [Treponema phagedenis F0421]TYT78229.1 alanine racemase [Treponema phagedenis]
MRATKAIIHLDNLQYNIAEIKKRLKPGVKICLPVKADAYGHGAFRVAVAAIRAGVSSLAVASIQEGIDLRNAGIVAPIISLSLPILEEIHSIIEYNIHPLVIDSEFIHALNEEAARMKTVQAVHLKIDTGMNRIGCKPEDAITLAAEIVQLPNLKLEGVCTHFSVADSVSPENIAYTKKQLALFTQTLDALRAKGIDPGIVHAANSGAVLQYPEAQFDMVRPGIIVYGYPPSDCLADKIPLKPVMELVSQVVLIKCTPQGSDISYDRKWHADKDTFIATLPIGYADGLMRALSPGLKVRIGDTFYPIVGRICMDQCMVDLGSEPTVTRWDTAVIFGPSENSVKNNSAKELATIAGTIPYEITCDINKRVPRVYINEKLG